MTSVGIMGDDRGGIAVHAHRRGSSPGGMLAGGAFRVAVADFGEEPSLASRQADAVPRLDDVGCERGAMDPFAATVPCRSHFGSAAHPTPERRRTRRSGYARRNDSDVGRH
jgi:hypothetical protein